MKKLASLAFVFIFIFVSLCGCSKPAKEETTTATTTATAITTTTTTATTTAEGLDYYLNYISEQIQKKEPASYGGIKMSLYEDILDGTKKSLYSVSKDTGPLIFSIKELSHPDGTEGYCQFSIMFKEIDIKSIITEDGKQYIFLRGYSPEYISKSLEEKKEAAEGKFGFVINQLNNCNCYEVEIWQ